MTTTVGSAPHAELHDGRVLRLFDPRRLTAPAPPGPLLVLMGVGGIMRMPGAVFALALLGIRSEYHDGLAMLVALGVQRVQLGLGLDVPLAIVATRTSRVRLVWMVLVAFSAICAALGMAGVFPNGILLYLSAFGVIQGTGALTSISNSILA